MLSGVVERLVVACPVCGATFETRSALKNHVNALHLRKKSHRCNACGEGFVWYKTLWRHQHTPGKCPCAGAVPFELP